MGTGANGFAGFDMDVRGGSNVAYCCQGKANWGLSKTADLSEIILERRLPGQEFKYKQTKLNLKKLILKGDLTQNPYLFDDSVNSLSYSDKVVYILNLTKGNSLHI